jgi:[ribosomal protein S5]-alanine N-acetyltransferase
VASESREPERARNDVMVGERVYLRPLEVEDAGQFAEASHFEPDTIMNRGRTLISPIATEHIFRELYTEEGPFESFALAVCLIEDDRCIGLVDLDGMDMVNGVAETGSWIHDPDYRGKGYGTEAKHLLLEYVFERLFLERVYARVFATNPRSAAALAKQGYRPAGRVKYHDLKDGRFQDMLLFDLTREEWITRRGSRT